MTVQLQRLEASPKIKNLQTGLAHGQTIKLSNVKTGLKVFLSWMIHQKHGGHLLYVAGNERDARKTVDVLKKLGVDDINLYPLEPIHTYFSDAHSQDITQDQMAVIERLVMGRDTFIVTSADALLKRMLPLDEQRQRFIPIKTGDTIDPEVLSRTLVNRGYTRVDQVEARGQFAVRGGIVDVFCTTAEQPWRLDFFDDEVETIKTFDVETQRSGQTVSAMIIAPARKNTLTPEVREQVLRRLTVRYGTQDRYANVLDTLRREPIEHDETLLADCPTETLMDYLGDCRIVWDEPERAEETCNIFLKRAKEDFEGLITEGILLPEEKDTFLTFSELWEQTSEFPQAVMTLFSAPQLPGTEIDMHAMDMESFTGHIPVFVDYVTRRVGEGYRIHLCCKSENTLKNIKGFLEEQQLSQFIVPAPAAGIQLDIGELVEGFELPEEGIAFVNESDIFHEQRKKRKRHRVKGRKIDSFAQLKVGDYVVHDVHGIGIYRGVEQMTFDGLTKDLMVIEYEGDARFYLSIEQMDAVQAYIGTGGDRKPKLNKLGRPEWAKAKNKARKAVEDMAEELIALYAKRRAARGYAFGPDTTWQREFEDAFPYEETDDQLRCVEEIKADMERDVPMDRLLCGDVGYGKTEVALRAAFKAIMEGKQVAILVPTTILAQQHYNTIAKRFGHYPVAIDIISRFRTTKQQKQTIADVADGKVDLIVGTHRLLSKDISFKDLGLLIIDEEQRFGVRSKEKLKNLRENVDVLTLSATPIPRTLHMSMSGVRDMSLIEEPPHGRRPVQTYVMQFNPVVLTDAIERELARNGQVYFVHNRVHDIDEVAGAIQRMVPDARIVVAHGKMSGAELEDVMMAFLDREYDILVTTTIVESGMDVSNANTMIVDNGDRFGLSQLYQLRGRVGRSDAQAYCYVTHRKQVLTDIARKRLKAIKDFTAFGSGFKVAMRDLEIRGAGNLLGAEQSGHLFSIGYEMYCRILEETMASRIEGRDPVQTDKPLKINLDADAFVPENYIDSEEIKYDIYKKLSYIRTDNDYEDMMDELVDRFGPVPQGVCNLMVIAMIKHLAQRLGIIEIRQRQSTVRFYFDTEREMPLPAADKIPLLFMNHGVKFKGARNRDDVWSIELKQNNQNDHLLEILNFLKEL